MGVLVYLEISTNDQEIYPIPIVELTGLFNRSIDRIECTMSLYECINILFRSQGL